VRQSACLAEWLSERSRNGGVDEIPLPVTTGRLWLCGKHFVGPSPEWALERTGASTLVCLNERSELDDRYPDYVHWLQANASMRAIWFPIPDLHAPTVRAAVPLLDELRKRLDVGDGILLHCGAGIGRAGTIAAALLITLGMPRDAATQTVADHRPGAGPEAGAQADLLVALARKNADECLTIARSTPATTEVHRC